MTPCEKRGFREGDVLEVIEDYDSFPQGTVVTLISDDGDSVPLVENHEGFGEYVPIDNLRKPVGFSKDKVTDSQEELTGGSVDYYKSWVKHPTSDVTPYQIEVNDFIEAFDLNFAEGNIVKAIARLAQLRKDAGKPGSFEKYEAEKQKFFADRVYLQNVGK